MLRLQVLLQVTFKSSNKVISVNDYIDELETKLKLIDNKFGIIEDKVKEFLENSVQEQFNKMTTPAYKASPTYEDKTVFLVNFYFINWSLIEKFKKERGWYSGSDSRDEKEKGI